MNLIWYAVTHLFLRAIQVAFSALSLLAGWWITVPFVEANKLGNMQSVLSVDTAEKVMAPAVVAGVSMLVVLAAEVVAISGKYMRKEFS